MRAVSSSYARCEAIGYGGPEANVDALSVRQVPAAATRSRGFPEDRQPRGRTVSHDRVLSSNGGRTGYERSPTSAGRGDGD
jgi:hypothetical protein